MLAKQRQGDEIVTQCMDCGYCWAVDRMTGESRVVQVADPLEAEHLG